MTEFKEQKNVIWLGKLPKNWKLISLRYGLSRNDGGVWGKDPTGDMDTPVLRSTEQGLDGSWKINDPEYRKLSKEEINKYKLLIGDIVITKSSGSSLHIGKSSMVSQEMEDFGYAYSNFMQRIRTNNTLSPDYLIRILNSRVAREQFAYFSNTTTGLSNINAGTINGLTIPLPPLPEQQAIAVFLDRETARLDILISRKERLLELLEEKRKAIISKAVTRGLDASVPLKDSGVEWLGQVPEHWRVQRLKQVAAVQSGVAKGRDLTGQTVVEMPYLRVANVQDGFLALDDVATISIGATEISRYLLQNGDVLMNEGGDNDKLGRGAVWRGQLEKCIHQNHVFAVRPKLVESDWLALVNRTDYAKFFFYQKSNQSTNLASISSTNLKELPVVVPPQAERAEILMLVQTQVEKVDALYVKLTLSVEKLREYRTSLISAAVTGKIDVRGEMTLPAGETL